jgi:hypothetical protein
MRAASAKLRAYFSRLVFTAVMASFANAAGPGDLASLKKDQVVAGAFRVEALYLDPAGAPKGARFVHERGAVVDVLFFDSIPQLSVSFRTLPDDERGEAHALEHLLTGKGSTGRRLNTLMSMRMGQFNAGTDHDATAYQFSSAAGAAEFDELLDAFLEALIRPDFTDEEIRREVSHVAPLGENGRVELGEAGSVYNEMLSRMAQPDAVLWDQAGRMTFGADHPLARNSGGDPDEMWSLSPAQVRAFHAAHYHLDGNMEMVAALPPSWSATDFLSHLDLLMRRLEPRAAARAYAGIPPFSPAAERGVRIGKFPSQDQAAPQDLLMSWPPVPTFGVDEQVRLDLTLDLLGGAQSYLSRDILDEGTRKFDSGATNVSMGASVLPASYATFQIYGLPTASITPRTLGRLRDVVIERVRWMHDLKAGDSALAELAVKARARIRARRRGTLKYLDGPPHFGDRTVDPGWHHFLDQLALAPGFVKSLGEDAALDRLLKELDAGENPWAGSLERAGMLRPPYVAAVLPDAELLNRQKARKDERLRAKLQSLAAEYGVDESSALERYRAETDSATAALDRTDDSAPKPSFLREPPLELDRIDWSEGRLPSGPRFVTTRFQTAFTDVSVAFDLSGVSEEDRELLPILAVATSGMGVVTREGDRVDDIKAKEMIQTDIQGLDVDLRFDQRGDRAELTFTGRASSPDEVGVAVDWLETYLLRPDLSVQSRESLKGWIVSSIQSKRELFQQDEASWADDAAASYRYQDRPLYMHTSSPFTVLRDLERLRWRLEEPSPAQFAVLRATAAAALEAARAADRPAAAGILAGVGGELGETLRWNFSRLPDDSWRRDLAEIVTDYLGDLGRSQETILRLQKLIANTLVRAGARVHVNGAPQNIETAVRKVDALLARLPQGRRPDTPRRRGLVLERLRQRLPGLARPTYVALVNDSGKTGTVNVTAPAATYRSHGREELLDVLALDVLAGGGAPSLYMRTISAGLAYSNGIGQGNSVGEVSYGASKCPSPAQTLRFVDDAVSSFKLDDPFLLEYALSNAFADYRAGEDFSARGDSLADDLEAGESPETVRAFKTALLRLAREPGTLAATRAALVPALRRLLIGLPGGKISASPRAAAFFIGPEDLIRPYEAFVRERGDAASVVRLYPRDFWP